MADDRGGTAIAVFPGSVAKQQDGGGARLVIGGEKSASQDGPDMQHVKQPGGGVLQVKGRRGIAALA
jgi:hypothetical protein